MGKVNLGEMPQDKRVAPATAQRMRIRMIVLVPIIAAVSIFLPDGRQLWAQSTVSPATRESAAAPGAQKEFGTLRGRWVRPDGGYVVEIKEVDANGKMVAAYFNPRPINVARAEAALEGTTLKVFIELRDTNYPGATYNLTYDPGREQLRGVYFQPALQQSFEVFFVRMK